MKRNSHKLSTKRHALPKVDRRRASVYAAHMAAKAKFERENERRREIRRAEYQTKLERLNDI